MLSRHQKGWLDLGYLSRGVKRKRVLLVGKSGALKLIKLALNGGEAANECFGVIGRRDC